MLPLALACAALFPAGADAFVGCKYSAGAVTVTLSQEDDAVTIQRDRGTTDVNVITGAEYDGPSILVNCKGGDPTVTNTDTITIEVGPEAFFSDLSIDLGEGSLAPGATPEADGTSEIEIRANVLGEDSDLTLIGSAGPDLVQMGRIENGLVGANLNAAAEGASADVDLSISSAADVEFEGEAGNDVLLTRGGPGFRGRLGKAFLFAEGGDGRDTLVSGADRSFLSGDDGRDRLLGSNGADIALGGDGRDVIKTGNGEDRVQALRGGRDKIDCGGGKSDRARLDRKDRSHGCEQRRHGRRGRRPILLPFAAARVSASEHP